MSPSGVWEHREGIIPGFARRYGVMPQGGITSPSTATMIFASVIKRVSDDRYDDSQISLRAYRLIEPPFQS
jgi:hypothetical protein